MIKIRIAPKLVYALVCAVLVCSTTFRLFAQEVQSGSWYQTWSAQRYQSLPQRYAWPDRFRGYALNEQQLRSVLSSAPAEFSAQAATAAVILQLPMPDGSFMRFRVVETFMMHPQLAAQFPSFKTYSGQGIENPAAILKLSITGIGVHAMVLSPDGNVFIDPMEQGNIVDHIAYYRADFKPYATFQCELDEVADKSQGRSHTGIAAGQTQRSHGTTLRNYRLALSCTGEYAAFYGGTTSGAMSGMVASMNRVNGIYETEVAVRMTMVANNNLLIYLNASTDPFTNTNGSTMLGQNISTCNSVIGSANYDIGHVFSTGGGGVAYLGVPCTTNKAGGVTGSGSPVGDAFDVDYVAHEMGHQFGGQHTFNASSGSCSGNRSATSAFEPGSGITIMAYAGICSATNDLAPNSIAYFHTHSFDQITTYITTGSGNSCPTATATGNTPPVATPAALNYTIPYQTPFTLTATGTDANGDALTYSWEEYDLGASGNWNAPSGDAPIFRPFPPVTSGSRTFPKISDIVNNTTTIGEILPSYARTLKFRVTVRDNRAGGGGVMHPDDTVRVAVVNTGAPFAVTAPNTAVTWLSGQPATVTWNVSGTSAAPISCANVSIQLSNDGGFTYPFTILSSTPNDGTETITVPSVLTSTARIRVQAVGNIFFDISNVNFTIQAGSAALTTLATSAITGNVCAGQPLNVTYNGDGPANAGNIFTAQLSNSAGSFAAPVVIGTLSSTSPSGTISCTIPAGTLQANAYRIRVVASAPAVTGSDNGTALTVYAAVGAAATITGSSAVCQGQSGLVYSIPAVSNASSYAWTLPSGFSISSGAGTNSITVSVSASAVSGAITVLPSNPCNNGTVSPSFAVTVSPLPANAATITGTNPVCPGQAGVVYAVPTISGATSYLWTVPSGATIVAGTGTNSITVDFGTSAVTGVVTARGVNNCGNGGISSFNVVVSAAPAAPVISASGATNFCTGGSVVLTFTPTAGVNYQWRKNGTAISGATGTSYTATTAGNYDVVASLQPTGSQLFNSTAATNIPDNSCTGANNAISVSGYTSSVPSSGIYVRMNITHTWVGDLDIFLEAPNGQKLGLSDQTGNANNSANNFTNTVFADSGAAQIPTSGAPYTGLYKPWTSLFTVTGCTQATTITTFAALGGGSINPNGTWTLRAYDRAATDSGAVTSWSIFFPYAGGSCTVPSNSIAVTVNPAPAISSFTPGSGPAGTAVTINGSGFNGVSEVRFNGTAAVFSVVNSSQLTATVPASATSGNLSVVATCGTAVSSTAFTVPPLTATLNVSAFVEGMYLTGGSMTGALSPSQSDTLFLSLRSTTSPYASVVAVAAPMNLSGQVSVQLPGSCIGNAYYLVVRTRNSLETWSKLPVSINSTTSYSFKQ